MQTVHTVEELQADQFVGQSKQKPFDKYLPVVHVEHSIVEEHEQPIGQIIIILFSSYAPFV